MAGFALRGHRRVYLDVDAGDPSRQPCMVKPPETLIVCPVM